MSRKPLPLNQAEEPGDIIIPYGVSVAPHEMEVAKILASSGKTVEFIPVRRIPTPDICYDGKDWEIKSPTGSSSRTLENNLRSALQQSSNIIIDLRRIKLPENHCLRELRRQTQKNKQIRRLYVITKDRRIIDFL